MVYTFEQIFAADPSSPGNVASNGVVTIFTPGDTTKTPLPLTTVNGLTLPNPIKVNDQGFGPAFIAPIDRVAWEGGGFTGFLTSYDGMKEEAVAARAAADKAAAAAEKPSDEAVEQGIARADIPGTVAKAVAAQPTVAAAAAAAVNASPKIAQIEARELPDRGRLNPANFPEGLDSLTLSAHKGSWAVWTANDATSLGAPSATAGEIRVYGYGNVTTQEFRFIYSAGPVIMLRQKAGTGPWGAWGETRNTRYEARLAELEAKPAPITTRTFRTVPLSLTLGRGGTDAQVSGVARYPFRFNATINRYRVHIVNQNPRVGPARTDAVAISGIAVGTNKNGAMSASHGVSGPTSIPAGQSHFTSRWIDTPIGDDREMLLSLGYTATAAPYGLAGGGWLAPDPAQFGAASPAGLSAAPGIMPFQVWLEAETPAGTQVVAGFGDSLTVGQNATQPVNDSWLSQYCRSIGALPVHYAASGDSMSGWTTDGTYKWNQWAALDRADVVIWSMGSNDVFGGATLAELQTRHNTVAPLVRKYIADTVYAATVMPRTGVTGDMEGVRRTYNAWLRTLPNGVRDVFDFGSTISSDDETILPEYDADGTHLNTAGYGKLTSAIRYAVVTPAAAKASEVPDLSGPVNLTEQFTADTGAAKVTVSRYGQMVQLTIYDATPKTVSGNIMTLPVGYRPVSELVIANTGLYSGPRIIIRTDGRVDAVSLTASTKIYADKTWITGDVKP